MEVYTADVSIDRRHRSPQEELEGRFMDLNRDFQETRKITVDDAKALVAYRPALVLSPSMETAMRSMLEDYYNLPGISSGDVRKLSDHDLGLRDCVVIEDSTPFSPTEVTEEYNNTRWREALVEFIVPGSINDFDLSFHGYFMGCKAAAADGFAKSTLREELYLDVLSATRSVVPAEVKSESVQSYHEYFRGFTLTMLFMNGLQLANIPTDRLLQMESGIRRRNGLILENLLVPREDPIFIRLGCSIIL